MVMLFLLEGVSEKEWAEAQAILVFYLHLNLFFKSPNETEALADAT